VVDFLWKLSSVTLAAQVLTLPVSIYHFHQMPLLFLLTNLVAVPLSSIILIGLLLLCGLSFLPVLAGLAGSSLSSLIQLLNTYIEGMDKLPFVTWGALYITVAQTVLLLLFSFFFCYWLIEKQRRYAWIAFTSIASFMAIRGLSFFDAYRQKKLIVYNVPKHTAIDIIGGRIYAFMGDSLLLLDGFERNFHLQPSRIRHRISLQQPVLHQKDFRLGDKQVLLLDEALPFAAVEPKQKIDLLILSKNPKVQVAKLLHSFRLGQVVIDGSVPPWKAAMWKKECDSLAVPCYNVGEKGAFIMNW
jgi:competence protein ComEC